MTFLIKKHFLNLNATIFRFPLAYVCLAVLVGLAVNGSHEFYRIDQDLVIKLSSIFTLGVIWFINVKLYIESLHQKYFHYLVQVIGIGVFGFLAHHIFSTNDIAFLMAFLPGLVLLFPVIPFLLKKDSEALFWHFSWRVVINIFLVLFLVFIFVVALMIVGITIRELLYPGLDIVKTYLDIGILGCTIGVSYFLSILPEGQEGGSANVKIRALLTYIFIPIILLWFVVLYLYLVKIIIQFKIPQGEVGWMVSLFGIMGIIIHLLSYPFRKDSKPLKLFYQYFYIVFAPLVLLLAVAIGFRVQQYGLTESRYFVSLLTLWFLYLVVNYIIMRKSFSIRFAPGILGGLLILASFGPLSITKLPITNQTAILKTLLVKNSILIDERITAKHGEVSPEAKARIRSIVSYLVSRKDGLFGIKNWFSTEQFKKIEAKKLSGTYGVVKVVIDLMGLGK